MVGPVIAIILKPIPQGYILGSFISCSFVVGVVVRLAILGLGAKTLCKVEM